MSQLKGKGKQAAVGIINRHAPRCSECLFELLEPIDGERLLAQDLEPAGRKKVFDFLVAPGEVSAKVTCEGPRNSKVQILCRQLAEEEWGVLFDEISRKAVFSAALLAGRLPWEIAALPLGKGSSLFPSSLAELSIFVDSKKTSTVTPQSAPVLQVFAEMLDSAPFALFTLRGRGKEESLLEVGRRRAALRQENGVAPVTVSRGLSPSPAPSLEDTLDHFWSAGPALYSLSYSLRADELPASVLKRLDPLPLAGLEDEIEYLLEEAYVLIARRAQAFGLGM